MSRRESVFVGHYTIDLPIVRMIQILLEEKGYQTYFIELGQIDFYDDGGERIKDYIIGEMGNTRIDYFFEVQTSYFHRSIESYRRRQGYTKLRQQQMGTELIPLNVDSALTMGPEEQRRFLSAEIDRAFAGRNDRKQWELLPPRDFGRMIRLADQLMGKIVQYVSVYRTSVHHAAYDQLVDEVLGMLRATDGRVDAALLYLILLNKIHISDEHQLMYNRIFQQFHPYPPYVLQKRVFLSHSSENVLLARQIQLALEKRGIRTFLFRLSTLEGEDYSRLFPTLLETIGKEVASIDAIVNVRTAHYDRSFWTAIEQSLAVHFGKPLYYLDVEDCKALEGDALESCLEAALEQGLESEQEVRLEVTLPLDSLVYVSDAKALLESSRPIDADDFARRMNESAGRLMDAVYFVVKNDRLSGDSDQRLDEMIKSYAHYAGVDSGDN